MLASLQRAADGQDPLEPLYRALLASLERDPASLRGLLEALRDRVHDEAFRRIVLDLLAKAVETLPNASDMLAESLDYFLQLKDRSGLALLLHSYASNQRGIAAKLLDTKLVDQLLQLAFEEEGSDAPEHAAALEFLAERTSVDLEVRRRFVKYAMSDAPDPVVLFVVTNGLMHASDPGTLSILTDLAIDSNKPLPMRAQMTAALLIGSRESPRAVPIEQLIPTIKDVLNGSVSSQATQEEIRPLALILQALSLVPPDPDLVLTYLKLVEQSPSESLRMMSVGLLQAHIENGDVEGRLGRIAFDPKTSDNLRNLIFATLAANGTDLSLRQMDSALDHPALSESDRAKIQQYRDWLARRLGDRK